MSRRVLSNKKNITDKLKITMRIDTNNLKKIIKNEYQAAILDTLNIFVNLTDKFHYFYDSITIVGLYLSTLIYLKEKRLKPNIFAHVYIRFSVIYVKM